MKCDALLRRLRQPTRSLPDPWATKWSETAQPTKATMRTFSLKLDGPILRRRLIAHEVLLPRARQRVRARPSGHVQAGLHHWPVSSTMRARRHGRIHARYTIVLLNEIFLRVVYIASCSPAGLGVSSAVGVEVCSFDGGLRKQENKLPQSITRHQLWRRGLRRVRT
jgi:hypothetical protein